MASLSEEMRYKRDIRRKSTILIIDKDLGNFGLYKSILAMEYELECVHTLEAAASFCRTKFYDVIIADGCFEAESIEPLYDEVKQKYKENYSMLFLLEEPQNKDSIISYLSIGAEGYIPKPFTKDGIMSTIREHLSARRKKDIMHSVLVVDEDYENLCQIKRYIDTVYNVIIVNVCEEAVNYIEKCKPNLVICEIGMFEKGVRKVFERIEENGGKERIPIMFMTETPDAETVSKCAQFRPEGFLIKPVEEDGLIKTLERIFLMESYTGFVR